MSLQELSGACIAVTRAKHQVSIFAERLEAKGAHVIAIPTLEVLPPEDQGKALHEEVAHLEKYAWIIFTSVNTVHAVFTGVSQLQIEIPKSVSIAVIGTATQKALNAYGYDADIVPPKFLATSLVSVFPCAPEIEIDNGKEESGNFHTDNVLNNRVFLPQAADGKDTLIVGLQEKGWVVTRVDAYKKNIVEALPENYEKMRACDIITFTSGSAVDNFIQVYGKNVFLPELITNEENVNNIPRSTSELAMQHRSSRKIPKIATIGPVTSLQVNHHGLSVDLEAMVSTIDGFIDALVQQYGNGI